MGKKILRKTVKMGKKILRKTVKHGSRVVVDIVGTVPKITSKPVDVVTGRKAPPRRLDPIFKRRTPLLFAHRGGAREAPESTERALRWALQRARADVLELDVQVTKDDRFILWHGPRLDNVIIADRPLQPSKRNGDQNDIREYLWTALKVGAWVIDPHQDLEALSQTEVAHLTSDPTRRLLLLEDALALFPNSPVNIEIKVGRRGSFEERHLRALSKLLDADRRTNGRPILVACQKKAFLDHFRDLGYATGLSMMEGGAKALGTLVPFLTRGMGNRAIQAPYPAAFSGVHVVRKVRKAGGAVHVFITGFGDIPSLDERNERPTEKQLFKILNRSVDGVMTDRPLWVRGLLDKWIAKHP